MSIYTDMIVVTLQRNDQEKGNSGAQVDNWVIVENIDVAIYKNDSFKSSTNAKYESSSHSGLTFWKGFEEGKEYRMLIGMSKYDITYFNETGRTTTLLLKQVNMYE